MRFKDLKEGDKIYYLLCSTTKYYFEVVSGDTTYNNGVSTYTITTYETLSSPPSYVSISGTVSNMPASNEAIVIAYIKDKDSTGTSGSSGVISTVVDDTGKWILSIADSRSSDGSEYYEYTSSDVMYFNVLSTISDFDLQYLSMNGITSTDITITIPASSTSSSVGKLNNYGVI